MLMWTLIILAGVILIVLVGTIGVIVHFSRAGRTPLHIDLNRSPAMWGYQGNEPAPGQGRREGRPSRPIATLGYASPEGNRRITRLRKQL